MKSNKNLFPFIANKDAISIGNNKFNFKLFSEIQKEKGEENVIFSSIRQTIKKTISTNR
jgi:serine protease inhibitor